MNKPDYTWRIGDKFFTLINNKVVEKKVEQIMILSTFTEVRSNYEESGGLRVDFTRKTSEIFRTKQELLDSL